MDLPLNILIFESVIVSCFSSLYCIVFVSFEECVICVVQTGLFIKSRISFMKSENSSMTATITDSITVILM